MFRLKTFIVCFVWIEFSFGFLDYVSCGPEQVHISYGGKIALEKQHLF